MCYSWAINEELMPAFCCCINLMLVHLIYSETKGSLSTYLFLNKEIANLRRKWLKAFGLIFMDLLVQLIYIIFGEQYILTYNLSIYMQKIKMGNGDARPLVTYVRRGNNNMPPHSFLKDRHITVSYEQMEFFLPWTDLTSRIVRVVNGSFTLHLSYNFYP